MQYRGRGATPHGALVVSMVLAAALATGCGSIGMEYRPYAQNTARSPILKRAVRAEQRDLRALARAGAVIIGTVVARGNGFAGPAAVEEVVAREAARRGGTHIVLQSAGCDKARPSYEPGEQIALRFMVIRLGDANEMAHLPRRLRPRRGLHYRERPAFENAQIAYATPKPLAQVEQTPPVRVIDGSHLKPLP